MKGYPCLYVGDGPGDPRTPLTVHVAIQFEDPRLSEVYKTGTKAGDGPHLESIHMIRHIFHSELPTDGIKRIVIIKRI